jgi:uncharacterized protein YcfL
MKIFLLVPLLLGLLLAGCSTVNSIESVPRAATAPVVADNRVVTDIHLDGALSVGAVRGDRVGDLRRISTTLVNQRDSVLVVACKVEWLDQNGVLLPSPSSGWKRLRFEGRESLSFSDVAISPQATDFRLKFLRP